jgi:hypothetical protein
MSDVEEKNLVSVDLLPLLPLPLLPLPLVRGGSLINIPERRTNVLRGTGLESPARRNEVYCAVGKGKVRACARVWKEIFHHMPAKCF